MEGAAEGDEGGYGTVFSWGEGGRDRGFVGFLVVEGALVRILRRVGRFGLCKGGKTYGICVLRLLVELKAWVVRARHSLWSCLATCGEATAAAAAASASSSTATRHFDA